jgi:alkylated DNA repair protein (DNA oxidative demethylase)
LERFERLKRFERFAPRFMMSVELPEGFVYRPDFLTEPEEGQLLAHLKAVDFSELRMRERLARRRVAHFGWLYGYDSWKIEPGPPIPEFLRGARERAASLVHVKLEELVEVLVTEYPPGAPIGWHRDAPMFGVVVAVSLLSPARLRLREGSSGKARVSITINPRSAYVLSGAARSKWQHSISPTKATRYSITFRTLRAKSTE